MNPHSVALWLNTAQAGARAGRHQDTVKKACEAGTLHGAQRQAGGHWRIRPECVDAWVAGEPCVHQAATAGVA